MSSRTAPPASRGKRFERALGRYSTGRPGPTVVICGGVHGNEPAGAYAAERVAEEIERTQPPLRGEFVAVAGNVAALEQSRRYLAMDLNRCWLTEHVERVRRQPAADDNAEEAEQRALLEILDDVTSRATELVVFDLHTTSADGPPFSLMSDTLRNRRIAFQIPGPVVLGLEESVDGTLLEYLTEAGHAALVVESGQHSDPGSIDRHEAVIWLGLVAAGALRKRDVPRFEEMERRLSAATNGLPRVVELRHHHAIDADTAFRMRPGYKSFDRVQHRDAIAEDEGGPILAPEDGMLLMPLYQTQGDDGFFLVSRVGQQWLALSALLRRLRLGIVLPLFPGVERHPELSGALRVDPEVARYFTVEILHLFGFRRRRPEGQRLVFTRRRPG